ncbi:MAG: 50S ribosomal protein L30e [Candidatus Marsarchaeota archaeon]|nr:50S ribosomal protein L30e [Candidatus Marsarchaeota archaeon]MCL5094480.1 50S ribosomal protein L30e [Candidatus Marsarchaeota archaeon]
MIHSNDIRLAVDSGEVMLGIKQVLKSIENNSVKLVIMASINKEDNLNDIKYISNIANIKLELFNGTSAELGSVCGKPYSVSVLSVINPGNSNILKNLDNNNANIEDSNIINQEGNNSDNNNSANIEDSNIINQEGNSKELEEKEKRSKNKEKQSD